MKLIIIAMCWQRYDIFEIFAQNVKKFGIDVYCGVSEDIYKDICDRHDFHYFEVPNSTLGMKINSFFAKLKSISFDYMLILNSNNIMSDNFLQPYYKAIKKGIDFAGFMDSYYCLDNQLKYWVGFKAGTIQYKHNRDNEPSGHGRLLSRRLIEKLNWEPAKNVDTHTTDRSLYRKIQEIEHTEYFFTLKEKGIMHCGIKSDNNLHKFSDYEGKLVDIRLLKKLREYKMLKKLWLPQA